MPPIRQRDLNQFLQRRQSRWKRLELLLTRVEESGLSTLDPSEVREFGALYRQTSSDLVTARSRTANAEILDYLNDLVARTYAQVYRSRRIDPNRLIEFILADFPQLVRHAWKYLALSSSVCLVCFFAGWMMSRADPMGAYHFLPPGMVRSIPALREKWRNESGHNIGMTEMSVMSSFIMTHNIGIGLSAFAGGIFLGLPTLYVLVQTGVMVGVLGEGMSRNPTTAVNFWSLILPHGILELSAICVMGSAGFVLASALAAPGRRTLRDSLMERGRVALFLALGGGLMLVVAGLIEGFITPPAWIPPWVKLAFAALTLVGEVLYFARAGRSAPSARLAALLSHDPQQTQLPTL